MAEINKLSVEKALKKTVRERSAEIEKTRGSTKKTRNLLKK